jgi:uncharacterized protein DUF742
VSGEGSGSRVPPEGWIDDAAGPLVRSFALTGGRAQTHGGGLELLTYVVTTESAAGIRRHLHPEQQAILDRASTPASVAEIASHLDLPIGVVRVLLGDLLDRDAVTLLDHQTPPDDDLLKAVIHGLQSL